MKTYSITYFKSFVWESEAVLRKFIYIVKNIINLKNSKNNNTTKDKSLESWIWDAACSIRGVVKL